MFSSDYLTRLQQRMVALDQAAYREFAGLVAVLAWERLKANGLAGPQAGQFAKDCSWRLVTRIRNLGDAPVPALEEWLSGELDAALRQWLTELARDVHDAAGVQSDLMPNRRFTAAGLEIASQARPVRVVTGDLHDVFELPGNRVSMALGDASGHGAAAGLYCQPRFGAPPDGFVGGPNTRRNSADSESIAGAMPGRRKICDSYANT